MLNFTFTWQKTWIFLVGCLLAGIVGVMTNNNTAGAAVLLGFIIYLASPHSESEGLPAGATVLMAAIHEGNFGKLKELLEKKTVGVNDKDHDGRTALHYATFKQRLDMLDLLIAAGADILVTTNKGFTVRQIAEKKRWRAGIARLDELKGELK